MRVRGGGRGRVRGLVRGRVYMMQDRDGGDGIGEGSQS